MKKQNKKNNGKKNTKINSKELEESKDKSKSSIKTLKDVDQKSEEAPIKYIIKEPKDTKFRIFSYLSILVLLIGIVALSRFSIYLFGLNLIPSKYVMIGYIVLTLLLIPMLIILFKKHHYVLKTIVMILLIGLSSSCFYMGSYLKTTKDFLEKTNSKYSTISYSVIVLKDSTYSTIDDLKNRDISRLSSEEESIIKDNLPISFKETRVEALTSLVNDLLNKKADAIILENGYYTLALEEIKDFEENTKVIYTFEIKKEETSSSIDDTDMTKTPFILYISGIDQRGKITSVRGRSDVNQILVVNPKTHRILIVNTPRDYYVQLHGTTGLKDKLTHAGIYGIDKSVKTLEDFYGININHYVRVNFNTLEKLVDTIGGIDINSDKAFYMSHIKGRYVQKGLNHFDGKEALAYSRERYAYVTGDNHRGANQQQVITAIIDKVTSSKIIIEKYSDILKTLDGTFQTDLSKEEITALIKRQLNDMSRWEIESIAVTGRGSNNYTYSMGYNYLLYVMEPDMNSVETAKNKISEILNEN